MLSHENPREWESKQLIVIIDLRQWPGSWGEGTPISKSSVEKKTSTIRSCVYARGVFLHNFFIIIFASDFFPSFAAFFALFRNIMLNFIFYYILLHLMLCNMCSYAVCISFFSHWLWCLCSFFYSIFLVLTRVSLSWYF